MVLAVSGALLVVALLLDWWGFPSAFDKNPADLPDDVRFTAEAYAMSGEEEPDADAFRFFGVRDLVWLAAGLVGFGFGLLVLATRRVPMAAAAVTGVLALVAVILIATTLIWPPDFAELGPGEPRPFSIDLPLSRDAGGFVALVAALGMSVGVALAIRAERGLENDGDAANF